MSEITHIERSTLPWRPERKTECGLDVPRHPAWTRQEAGAKQKEMGAQRFSLFCCMTCLHTVQRHSTWQDDPASCLVRHAGSMTMRWGRDTEEKRRFRDELLAIAALIEAHREEFDGLVAGYSEVVDIADARRQKRRTQ